MRFQLKTKITFGKIFRLKKENCSNAEDVGKENKSRRADDRKVANINDLPRKREVQPIGGTDLRLRRFKSSEHYCRRRNGITEKDYFEFTRLKIRRVQQQIIDTYVCGWR